MCQTNIHPYVLYSYFTIMLRYSPSRHFQLAHYTYQTRSLLLATIFPSHLSTSMQKEVSTQTSIMNSKTPSLNSSKYVGYPLAVMQLRRIITLDPVTLHITDGTNWTDGNLKLTYLLSQVTSVNLLTDSYTSYHCQHNLSIFRACTHFHSRLE
jgi:hypothetical protein